MRPKPSILFIHNRYRNRGGEDIVVQNEYDALVKHGYEVGLMLIDNPKANNLWGKFSFISGILFNPITYLKVYAKVRKNRYDIIHVHNTFYKASPSVLWAAKHAGASTVITLHNYRLFCLNAILFRNQQLCMDCIRDKSFKPGIMHKCFHNSFIQSFILAISIKMHKRIGTWKKAADKIIVINPLMAEMLLKENFDKQAVVFKPNFIPDQTYIDYSKRSSAFLIAGRLEPEKGVWDVANLFRQLNTHLIIAGTGSLSSVLENLSKQNENISLRGLLDSTVVLSLLQQVRALIFASRLAEGMPLIILEAMSTGCIVVAKRSHTTSSIITHGYDGFLFDTIAELKSIILQLNMLPYESLNFLSKAARDTFVKKHSETMHIKFMAELYEQTVCKK